MDKKKLRDRTICLRYAFLLFGVIAVLAQRTPYTGEGTLLAMVSGFSRSGLRDVVMTLGIMSAVFSWLVQVITSRVCGVEMSMIYGWKYPHYITNIVLLALSSFFCIYFCSISYKYISDLILVALFLNLLSVAMSTIFIFRMCGEMVFFPEKRQRIAHKYLAEQLDVAWGSEDNIMFFLWYNEYARNILNDYTSALQNREDNPIICFFKKYYRKRLTPFVEQCLKDGRPYGKSAPAKFPFEVRALYQGSISTLTEDWQIRFLGCAMAAFPDPLTKTVHRCCEREAICRAMMFSIWIENWFDVPQRQKYGQRDVYQSILFNTRAAYEHLLTISTKQKLYDSLSFAENVLLIIAILLVLDDECGAMRFTLIKLLHVMIPDKKEIDETMSLRPTIFSAALKAMSILQRTDLCAEDTEIKLHLFQRL